MLHLLWGHLSVTKLQNLQNLQDGAISLILSARIKDRISSATLNVKDLIKLDQVVMVHKNLMGNVQTPLNKSSREDLRFQNMKQGE